MRKKLGKIFVKYLYEQKDIIAVPYDPAIEKDYYAFIKKNYDNDLIQFIFTSEIMAKLLNYYFLERKFTITKIDFMEEDESLTERIDSILDMINADRAYFSDLLNEIKFLIDVSSIDIKRMEFKFKNIETGKSLRMMVQVNGIFEIDENNYKAESTNLEKLLELLYDR